MLADLYLNSIPFIVVVVTIIGVYYIFTKPIYAFYIIIFTLPLRNFYIFFGTSFEIWKLLSFAFLVIKFPSLLKKILSILKKHMYIKVLSLLVLYIALSTIINNLFLINSDFSHIKGGFLKNEGRIISQAVFFILTVNLLIIPFIVIKKRKEFINCLLALFYSSVFLSFLGFLQFFIVRFSGINPFPIKGSNGISHSGYIANKIFRINSVAGEPKHMAIAMVIGITIILLCRIYKIKLFRYSLPLFLLLMFNLFYTFSTTGYVLLIVSLFTIYIIEGMLNFKIILISCFGLLLLIFTASNISGLEKDTFNKQIDRANFEIQDESIKNYFIDNPLHAITGTGLGNIHHYSMKYIPDSFPLFKDTPYKANSGLIYVISDYGLIGGLILVLLFYKILRKNIKILKSYRGGIRSQLILVANLSFVIVSMFIFRYNELFFLFFGIMLHLNIILENEMKHRLQQIELVKNIY